MGLFLFGSGMVMAMYLTALRLLTDVALTNRPLLLLAILLIVLGVQLIIMGLLGELIVRTYHESQDKPIYMIKQALGKADFKKSSE